MSDVRKGTDGPNTVQTEIINTLDGFVLVDAGPGTGKTRTLVERYSHLLREKKEISPQNVLMLTFTNNAASEMEAKIKKRLVEDSKNGLLPSDYADRVMARTFDSLCYSIVLDSAEDVGRFFGIKESLTRSAKLSVNESVNRQFFQRFFDRFVLDHLDEEKYGNLLAITAQNSKDVLSIINKLMSMGIVPLREGWFGYNNETVFHGDENRLMENLKAHDVVGPRGGASILFTTIKKNYSEYFELPDIVEDKKLGTEFLEKVLDYNNDPVVDFIHDVYHAYIRHSIISNTLTYSLNAIFALTLLYDNPNVRQYNSFEYMMIDEFQDTNNSQLMVSLMLLGKPNLCCVGDWKQGIYGFRNVSIDNIVNFDEAVDGIRRFLNEDVKRIPFEIPPIERMQLTVNYRSSKAIIDKAFDCLYLKANSKDSVNESVVRSRVGDVLDAKYDFDGYTGIRYVQSESVDDECSQVVKAIGDYMSSDDYRICKWNQNTESYDARRVGLGNIAILCTKGKNCRAVKKALDDAGIPSFLQGDMEIMSTREGKLCLAWLKFINNQNDPHGYIPILADLGYNFVELKAVNRNQNLIPGIIFEQWERLSKKRRRITDMLSELFAFYPDFDQDVVQAIINVLSGEHRNSLQTISSMITMIEDDIAEGTTYPMEATIDSDAVRIMTMHKSKGLEFDIVIIPFMDTGVTPMSKKPDYSVLYMNPIAGLRCTKEVGDFDGYLKVCRSWRTDVIKSVESKDYDEERRLMFVAMSRARQYVTLICGKHKDDGRDSYSEFMKGLSGCEYGIIVDNDFDPTEHVNGICEMPQLPEFSPRKIKVGVHDIMDMDFATDGENIIEGSSPKGVNYGIEVHDDARLMFNGLVPKVPKPEHARIKEILDGVSDAIEKYSEKECMLPVEGTNVVLKGYIDLLAVYSDHVEVHDYKTDSAFSDAIDNEYRLQLSVYANAAKGYYGLPCKCFIHYVSLNREAQPFDPMDMSKIRDRVEYWSYTRESD